MLTPFNRHKFPLPRREGIDHLVPRTLELWATNLKAAHRALAKEPLSSDEFLRAQPVVERWKLDADKDPKLWGAFDPSLVEQQDITNAPGTLSSIPEAWSEDLTQQPRLAILLHPNLCESYLPQLEKHERFEDAYRLSFSFRDDGTEITENRYVGIGCGQLT